MATNDSNLNLGLDADLSFGDSNEQSCDDFFNIPSSISSKYLTENHICDFFHSKKSDAIKFLHVNCRSLNKNFTALRNLLIKCHPITALAISETWLTPATKDIYQMPGYRFVSSVRVNKFGGGVGIFINDSYDYILRPDLSIMDACIECLFVDITLTNKSKVLIGCVYRPPNTDLLLFNSKLVHILSSIDNENRKLALISGDFNLDLLKHHVHAPTADFLNHMLSHSFFPTIRNPTRIADTSATLIDNIFINCIKNEFNSAILFNDVSDHLPVAIRIEANITKQKLSHFHKKRVFDCKSIKDFNTHLMSHSWDEVYQVLNDTNNPTIAFTTFSNEYKHIFNTFFPEKVAKRSNKMTPRHEWMTKGLIKSCNRKSKLYKTYRQNSTTENKHRYITYRNRLKSLLKKAERNFYCEKFSFCVGDMKKTWKLIGSVLNKNKLHSTVESFIVNGVLTDNKLEIVDRFNDYFINVGTNLASSIPCSSRSFSYYLKPGQPGSFSLFPTDASEIIQIVSDLQNKSSAGFDDIPVNIMKASISCIAEPISQIINSTFENGTFPDDLKIAKVCPVFKDGEKNTFSNYRPISVLPSFSKIFEKAIYSRLFTYFESKNIIVNNQYGFRQNHSTHMALLDMYDRLSTAIDRNEYAVGVFIDLSKAFDTLNHNILLEKLEHYGVRGVASKLLQNYLKNRYQYVSLNGTSSTMREILCGVPQGSILGPLLFLVYINDIINCSNILQFILFADDTNLFHSDPNIWDLMKSLNEELMLLSNWFKSNKLSLNVKKTNYIIFGRKRIPVSDAQFMLSIDGNVLEQVDNTKFLGVFIDSKLTWSKHIEHVSLKISKGLGIMGRLRNSLPMNILLTLYHTLLYPYLSYCNIVWGCANISLIQKLIVLQKRAIRIITRSSFRSSSNPLFIRLKLLKITDIYKFQIALFIYKFNQSLLPRSCLHYFVKNSVRAYDTRKASYFILLPFRTNVRARSIAVSGPRLWDNFPPDIQNCLSFGMIKQKLIEYFISLYY